MAFTQDDWRSAYGGYISGTPQDQDGYAGSLHERSRLASQIANISQRGDEFRRAGESAFATQRWAPSAQGQNYQDALAARDQQQQAADAYAQVAAGGLPSALAGQQSMALDASARQAAALARSGRGNGALALGSSLRAGGDASLAAAQALADQRAQEQAQQRQFGLQGMTDVSGAIRGGDLAQAQQQQALALANQRMALESRESDDRMRTAGYEAMVQDAQSTSNAINQLQLAYEQGLISREELAAKQWALEQELMLTRAGVAQRQNVADWQTGARIFGTALQAGGSAAAAYGGGSSGGGSKPWK